MFEPLLSKDGLLAGSVGRAIGVGEGRGIGLMIILAGVVMVMFAGIFGFRKNIREMERRSVHEMVNA